MEEEYYYPDPAIHPSKIKSIFKFDLNSEENKDILDNLFLSLEGSILAVKKDCVRQYLRDPDILEMRMLFKKTNDLKISNADEFYKFMAVLIPLDQD